MSPQPSSLKKQKTAIIIGAGPAGLTAAYELLTKTKIKPIVLEKSKVVGGISATYTHKGNSIDIGGHRFFSKSDDVIQWWLQFLPLYDTTAHTEKLTYRGQQKDVSFIPRKRAGKHTKDAMLLRSRKSSIVYQKKMFDYPLSYSFETVKKLGFMKMVKVAATYGFRLLFPRRPEKNLEDFYINRFGDEFYKTFFETYTEKVWGKKCTELSAEWGRQRVKGLSILRLLSLEVQKRLMPWKDLTQEETSLIEKFMYPSYGPGHLWGKVAEKVKSLGGEVIMEASVTKLHLKKNKVHAVSYAKSKEDTMLTGDYVFSTMPINELFHSFTEVIDDEAHRIATGLEYRDFITVGIAVPLSNVQAEFKDQKKVIKDNWLYIHDKNVQVGRIQIFNNWSPHLVAKKGMVWLGLEYFCFEGDPLWKKTNKQMIDFAAHELTTLGFIKKNRYQTGKVIRVQKAYPSYTGTYQRFHKVREAVEKIENLFLIGRNGMHKYNNQDHSMLTAMAAVSNIITKKKTKENIWSINTEQEYHERKKSR